MIKVKKGDIVRIRGYVGNWEVVQGADSDGEVSIKDKDGKGWFYVDQSELTSLAPNGVPEHHSKHPYVPPQGPTGIKGDIGISDKGLGSLTPTLQANPFVLSDSSSVVFKTEEHTMSNIGQAAPTRQVATVSLIDPDAGLKPELAFVKKFGTVVFDGSLENLKMKLVMDNDVAAILAKHNEKRSKEIDLSIRQSTGQEVKLLPVELSDLKWIINVQ